MFFNLRSKMIKFFNKIIKLIKKCFNKNEEIIEHQSQTDNLNNSITRSEAKMEIVQETWSHNANPTSIVEINFPAYDQEDNTTCESGILASDIEEDNSSTKHAEPLNSSIATDYTSDDEQFEERFSNSKNLGKNSIVPSLRIEKAIEYAIKEAEKEPATTTRPNSKENLSKSSPQLSNDGWA